MIIVPGNVGVIGYKDALSRLKVLKNELTDRLNSLDRSRGEFLWLGLYTLAICAQERLIYLLNDDLISLSIPWDIESDFPSISSTAGDAISYAEGLKDTENPSKYFLKALLLSFCGWTLLSTDERECAGNKGILQKILIDALTQTTLKIDKSAKEGINTISIVFYLGIKSDDPILLEREYSYKKQSIRDSNLIIIHNSAGCIRRENGKVNILSGSCYFQQTDPGFNADRLPKILDELISSFIKAA